MLDFFISHVRDARKKFLARLCIILCRYRVCQPCACRCFHPAGKTCKPRLAGTLYSLIAIDADNFLTWVFATRLHSRQSHISSCFVILYEPGYQRLLADEVRDVFFKTCATNIGLVSLPREE